MGIVQYEMYWTKNKEHEFHRRRISLCITFLMCGFCYSLSVSPIQLPIHVRLTQIAEQQASLACSSNNLAFSNFGLVMQNHMVTKHQDLNHFWIDDTLVEAELKQISLKAKWLFCKDVYILLQKVCLIFKLLSFRRLCTTWFLKLIHVPLLVCQPLFMVHRLNKKSKYKNMTEKFKNK